MGTRGLHYQPVQGATIAIVTVPEKVSNNKLTSI